MFNYINWTLTSNVFLNDDDEIVRILEPDDIKELLEDERFEDTDLEEIHEFLTQKYGIKEGAPIRIFEEDILELLKITEDEDIRSLLDFIFTSLYVSDDEYVYYYVFSRNSSNNYYTKF